MLNCLPLGGKKRCRHLLRVQAPSETRCSHPSIGCRGGGRLGLDWPHPRDRQGRRGRLDTRHSRTAEGYWWAQQQCLQGTNPSCQTCDLLYLRLVLVMQLLHRLLTPCRCLPSPAWPGRGSAMSQSWSLHHCKKTHGVDCIATLPSPVVVHFQTHTNNINKQPGPSSSF